MYTQVLEEPFAVGHTSRHRVQENLGDTQYNSITKEEKRGDFWAFHFLWVPFLQSALLRCDWVGSSQGEVPREFSQFIPSLCWLSSTMWKNPSHRIVKSLLSLSYGDMPMTYCWEGKKNNNNNSLQYSLYSNAYLVMTSMSMDMLFICEYHVGRKYIQILGSKAYEWTFHRLFLIF